MVLQALERSDVVWLCQPGDVEGFVAETWDEHGGSHQRVVCLQVQARLNGDHSPDAVKTVRLMVSPEDSIELLAALYHACNFAQQPGGW